MSTHSIKVVCALCDRVVESSLGAYGLAHARLVVEPCGPCFAGAKRAAGEPKTLSAVIFDGKPKRRRG